LSAQARQSVGLANSARAAVNQYCAITDSIVVCFELPRFRVQPKAEGNEDLSASEFKSVAISEGCKLPGNADGEFVAKAVFVEELFVGRAVFVDEAGDFDVVTAVFGDLEETAFAEPVDGLHAFGGFFDAKRRASHGIEREAVLEFVLEFDQHVEGRHLSQIIDCIIMQNFVIESEVVETDYQIGPLQFGEEVVDLFFAVNPVSATSGAVGDADAHAHLANIVPAADFVRRLLCFKIEVDDVLRPGNRHEVNGRLNHGEQNMMVRDGGGSG